MDSWTVVPGTIAGTVLGAYLLFRYGKKSNQALTNGHTRERQAVPVKGQPGVYKSALLTDEHQLYIEKYFEDVDTLYDAFLRGERESKNGPCLGSRGPDGKYSFISYSEVARRAHALVSVLVGKCGMKPGNSTHLGIYAKNSPEWFISILAAIQQSVVIVPLYDTLGPDAASFIVNQTEISVIVVDNVTKVRSLLSKKSELPTLKHIIVIDGKGLTQEDEVEAASNDVEILTFEDAVVQGSKDLRTPTLPNRNDTYIICYTSGTTGTPKGVMISHANIVANLSGWMLLLKTFRPNVLNHKEVHISYLPLSHMMEQMAQWNVIMVGSSLGYFSGQIQNLTDDIKALRPTLFPVVPRLLNRLYDAIIGKVGQAGFFARMMFWFAYNRKLSMLRRGIVTKDSIWDRLVFGKVQAQIGGRCHSMATGSAPISAEVLETCRVTLGATICEGYGQTECTALATCTWPDDWVGGHCGAPVPCAVIKLGDVPELNYYAKDGKGEIMVKGPAVTAGYYKDPERTAELFDDEGFVHTGDVGQLLPNGTIKIIDRKKHIFKLAQGEYVAPEKIENVYGRSPVLQQIYVDGDSLERWLIAIVVPEPNVLQDWNNQHGTPGRSLEEIYADEKAKEYVLSELHKIGKENKLNSIEQVKRVHLTSEVFSVENNLLTPTLKAKRPQLRQKYKQTMADIYKQYAN